MQRVRLLVLTQPVLSHRVHKDDTETDVIRVELVYTVTVDYFKC